MYKNYEISAHYRPQSDLNIFNESSLLILLKNIYTYLSSYRGNDSDHHDSEHEVRTRFLQYFLCNSNRCQTCFKTSEARLVV